jgi:hypothetical protein
MAGMFVIVPTTSSFIWILSVQLSATPGLQAVRHTHTLSCLVQNPLIKTFHRSSLRFKHTTCMYPLTEGRRKHGG